MSRYTPRNINIAQNSRKIDTEEKLIKYIKTMLGAPLLTVDITDDQIQLCIDDTFAKFSAWALDGQQNIGFVIQTQQDIGDYIIDDRVKAIYGCSLYEGMGSSSSALPSFGEIGINYIPYVNMEGQVSSLESYGSMFGKYSATGVAGGVAGGPSTNGNPLEQMEVAYVQMVQSQMMSGMFGSAVGFDFNASNHILRIFEAVSGPIMIEAALEYVPNPEYDSAYGHSWIKDYALNKSKLVWGQNIGKYSQTLIGGAEINYDRIIQEAQEQLEKLEEDLLNRYSEPLGIFSE